MQNVEAAGLGIGDGYPPRIMGVLNVSRESPYEPSVFDDPGAAAAYTDEQLIDEGADIVDVGLESANKRFDVLSAEEELARLETALEAIESVSGDAVFSIETRYHEVATAALDGGFDMVNDICGFADPEMPRVCEQHDAAVVKMASPPDLERPGALETVEEIYDALSRNGVTEKTIIDPAFGGWSPKKTLTDDRETFERLGEFRGLGRPILVSINRKNFLREFADRSTEDALPVSLAATSMAVERGAHIVRTHDVAETRDAAIIGHEFTQERFRNEAVGVEELHVRTPQELKRHFERIGAETQQPQMGVIEAFELSELTPDDQTHLSTAAMDHTATFVSGQQGTTGILFGTPAALVAIAGERGHPPTLARKLEAIADHITER